MNPLISFVVPAYNQAKFLTQALDSILHQTYTKWECIIINDGSTDNTSEVAEFWSRKDGRIKIVTQENSGVSATRNKGLKICTGEYIKFLDADDWISYDCLEKSLGALTNTEDLVITNFNVFDENTKAIVSPYCDLTTTEFNFDFTLTKWEGIPIHSGLIPVKFLKDFNFNETIKIYEDWIMWLHIFAQKPKVTFINEPLVVYRKWGKSATTNRTSTVVNQFYAMQFVINNFLLSKEQELVLREKFEQTISRILEGNKGVHRTGYIRFFKMLGFGYLYRKLNNIFNRLF